MRERQQEKSDNKQKKKAKKVTERVRVVQKKEGGEGWELNVF